MTLFQTTSTTFNFTFILCDIIYSIVFHILHLSLQRKINNLSFFCDSSFACPPQFPSVSPP